MPSVLLLSCRARCCDQDALPRLTAGHRFPCYDCNRIVEKTRLEINEKKKKLAPMIKELRQARGEFQQLEAVHTEKKNVSACAGPQGRWFVVCLLNLLSF